MVTCVPNYGLRALLWLLVSVDQGVPADLLLLQRVLLSTLTSNHVLFMYDHVWTDSSDTAYVDRPLGSLRYGGRLKFLPHLLPLVIDTGR